MHLTAQIQLKPSKEQAQTLRQTLEACNKACNWISEQAWDTKTFRQFDLHKLVYQKVRSRFGLSAQATVRCIAKVADAYKLDKKTQRRFRKTASQPYDSRIFRFCAQNQVSIWTLSGREKIPFVCGDHQAYLLAFAQGEVDLMVVRGKFYLGVTCDVEEPPLIDPEDVIGVDLGIVNLAVESDGTIHSGKKIEHIRCKFSRQKAKLQQVGTRSAKRKLKKISGKQSRFQRDRNHCISKAVVQKAQRLHSAIALEDLKGIRKNVKARRSHRARLANWGFFQLRSFLEYKSTLAGIPVFWVDPAYTSQTCPECGHIEKANRKDRDTFLCVECDFGGAADHIAAWNIRAQAVVNQPIVAKCYGSIHDVSVTSLCL